MIFDLTLHNSLILLSVLFLFFSMKGGVGGIGLGGGTLINGGGLVRETLSI